MPLRFCLALVLTCTGATSALAQLVTTFDAGAASVTYENAYRITAMSLTPSLRYEHPRASLAASGTVSRFETGSFSSSGAFSASVFSSGTARLRAELGGSLAGSAHEDGTRTGQHMGQLRGHLLGRAGGVWLGAAAGQSWNGVTWRMARSAEVGVWRRFGSLLVAGHLEPAGIGDTSYTDLEASARWTRGAFEIGAGTGLRTGSAVEQSPWAIVSSTWWLGRHFALSAAGGSYATDYLAGIPGGKYISVGVRLASRPPVIDPPRGTGAGAAPALARPAAGRLALSRTAGGENVLSIAAQGARRVELMGDFTDWKVVVLAPTRDGAWQFPHSVPPGTHRFNVRVDGGEWSVPSGVTTITDDFEGIVGILVVR